jgi:hypothetical protein
LAESTIGEGQKINLQTALKDYFPPETVTFPQLSFNMLVTSQYQENILFIEDYIVALNQKYGLNS